ncbi:MAG: RluA family pseudouridine synthase [Alphaproteobacteria bacterium]
MSGVRTVNVGDDDGELRLDRWFRRHYPGLSHGRLEKLLRTGQVRVDGKRAKAAFRVAPGMRVRIPPLDAEMLTPAPKAASRPRRDHFDQAEAARLRDAVLFKDDDILVLNKPPGLAVQGGTNTHSHVDAMTEALRFGAAERPRLVHRLDKDTSGVLVLGRNAAAAARLAAAFRLGHMQKIYWALTVGVPRPRRGRIDLALSKLPGRGGERMMADMAEGKRAVTYYTVVEAAGQRTAWLALMPETGRTHQLRVHCAAIEIPIQGDGKYGGKDAFITGKGLSRKLHLHARSLAIPRAKGSPRVFTAPLPPHMAESWDLFGFDPEGAPDPFAELVF